MTLVWNNLIILFHVYFEQIECKTLKFSLQNQNLKSVLVLEFEFKIFIRSKQTQISIRNILCQALCVNRWHSSTINDKRVNVYNPIHEVTFKITKKDWAIAEKGAGAAMACF